MENERIPIVQVNGQAERILNKLRREPVTLEWKNINFCVHLKHAKEKKEKRNDGITTNNNKPEKKCLLSNISGIARPGELLAIMGSSGAGKTTLLNTLAGRIKVAKGDELNGVVKVNGGHRDASWRRTAGYVEQFDLMYADLTVQETIQFAADFKLPREVTVGEKRAIVDRVIGLLGLTGVRHSRIGEETKRGISGGEKKRVAIGIELVTFPGLLFLDEPTTGLDSTTAQSLIETLKRIAERTRMTIILTIHQPRASILALFTRIVFMSQGKLIYNGTMQGCLDHFVTHFNLRCPEHENPADFVMDMLTVRAGDEESAKRVKDLQDKWKEMEGSDANVNGNRYANGSRDDNGSSDDNANENDINIINNNQHNNQHNNQNNNQYNNQYTNTNNNTTNHQTIAIEDHSHAHHDKSLTWPNTRAEEFGILLKRNFILYFRDRVAILATLGQTVFLMLLLSFVFFQLDSDFAGVQGRLGLLFFVSINIIFTTVNVLLAVFAVDRAILLRERSAATYRVLPSYSAKFIALLPQSLIFLMIFAIPLYFITGLTMPFDRLLVFLLMLAALRYASIGMGLCIASISPTVQISQIIGPLIIVIFLIFGGNLANSNEITWILRWIQYISIIFYAYQALAQNEFTGNFYGVQDDSAQLVPGEYYLNLYGLENVGEWGCLGAILGIGTAFLVLGYIGLRYSTKPRLTFI